MLFDIFQQSVQAKLMPENISVYLQAMWQDATGNWNAAHHLVDHLEDAHACRVHAYLHRKEGDLWNADYWYRKAGKKRPELSLQQEWDDIVKALL
jgi:hypothetical protein